MAFLKGSRLPPEAKMVFKGKIFEVWQWEQKLYDGTTATFERIKRPDTAQVITVVGDTILILKEEQPDYPEPFFSLPGGRCDEGEDPLLAAQRELLEETGYVSEDWELFDERNPHRKNVWTMYTYIARNSTPTKKPHLEAGEKNELHFLSFDEFLALSDDPGFRATGLIELMLRMRLDPEKKDQFKKLLFGHA